ncbi:MAG TPA: beta-L-arabinofuranosidase domain-containing protein [Chthonomonadaceae bacterium]|nr:beta-L-arabinofuranosidase domain-containing protein [Chthonomonadaceae bacterium]
MSKSHVEPTSLHTHEEKPFFHHTHSYLNTTHGVVDLAVITGERKYVEQAAKVFVDSLSSVWINGDFPESYGDYYERIDETCSAVDWMVLALKLFALTGESRYLDCAELTAVNQIPFGQDYRGTFTCYRSLNRHHWADDGNRGCPQNECCAMSGGWGLAQIALHTITQNASGLSVNLPFEVHAILDREDGEVQVTQSVWTGRYEMVQTLQIDNRTPKELEVRIRLPYWCAAPALRVNGMPCPILLPNGFVSVLCLAKAACSIELHLPMSLQIVPAGRSILTKDDQAAAGSGPEQGLQYGPYVLMFNRMMYPEIIQRDISITVKRDDNGHPLVRQEYPAEWAAHSEAIPLFVEAAVQKDIPALLTPCANMTMTALIHDDPYILRFANIL